MKNNIRIIALLMFFMVASVTTQKATAQVSVSFQVFYDDLSPYGRWVHNPQYGYVWVPRVSRFTPYHTNGHWVYTEDGWTWVSNYRWGWAPFHYGRWFYQRHYGWVWVPDNEWGPGWVTWRRSEDYCGWAPIAPGISIDVAYSSGYSLPYNQWTFVKYRDFGRPNINNYYVNTTVNNTIINNTTVINNTRTERTRNVRYNAGPERAEVEKHAGKTFTAVAIKESPRPGQQLNKGQLQIYRPVVQRDNASSSKPAPRKKENWKDDKTPEQRTVVTPEQRPNQPARQQKEQRQKVDPMVKQNPIPPQRIEQPKKERAEQPRKEPPVQRQPKMQPNNPEPLPPIRNNQQHQPPSRPERTEQPKKHEPVQEQKVNQPAREQHTQPQPVRPQPAPPQQVNPPKREEKQKQQEQPNPPQKKGKGRISTAIPEALQKD